jgi:hypothetical protein
MARITRTITNSIEADYESGKRSFFSRLFKPQAPQKSQIKAQNPVLTPGSGK